MKTRSNTSYLVTLLALIALLVTCNSDSPTGPTSSPIAKPATYSVRAEVTGTTDKTSVFLFKGGEEAGAWEEVELPFEESFTSDSSRVVSLSVRHQTKPSGDFTVSIYVNGRLAKQTKAGGENAAATTNVSLNTINPAEFPAK